MKTKLFSYFDLEKDSTAFFIKTKKQSKTIYTERSVKREALAIKAYAEESLQKNQRIIYIAPFLKEIYDLLDLNNTTQTICLKR